MLKPLIHKKYYVNGNCYGDCYNKYYHSFEYKCEYDIQLTNNGDNEIIILKIIGKSISLYEIMKKLTIARERSFSFIQINKLTIKIYSFL